MIIIFGWFKETKPVRPLFDCYCYHCSKRVNWDLWRETEWVSFFDIKTIPFLWKNFLVCSGCEDVFPLDWRRYLRISSPGAQAELIACLERHQLAPKSDLQRNFLLTQRAERESREKSAAQLESQTTAAQRLDFDGASFHTEPGEQVVSTFKETSGNVLGIVTRRPNGLFYASVLKRKDYDGLSEWGAVPFLDRFIVATAQDGEGRIRRALADHGYRLGSNE